MNLTLSQWEFIRELNSSAIKRAGLKAELLQAQDTVRALLLAHEPALLPSPTPSRLIEPALFREERLTVPKKFQPTTEHAKSH